jgi:arylsulfatase A-like enzyme
MGWDRGFDEYVETWHGEMTDDPIAYRRLLYAGRVNELARAAIERHRDAERLLVWVHYSDPHAPYVLPAEEPNPFLDDAMYRAAPEVKVELGGRTDRKVGDADDLRFYVAQYDANIRVVDTKAAELIDWLGKNGLLEDAAIVFFADHGEDLGEHRHAYFEHGRFTYNSTAHVPLFVVGPGIEPGRRVEPPVELVDLFPTLAAWFLPDATPEGLDGHSLLAAARGERPDDDGDARHSVAFSEAGRRGRERLRSVQDARWKLIFIAPNRSRPPRFELYDLEHDPSEANNLGSAPESETHVRRLMRQLHDWMSGANPSAPREPRTEEQLKALRALGYVD